MSLTWKRIFERYLLHVAHKRATKDVDHLLLCMLSVKNYKEKVMLVKLQDFRSKVFCNLSVSSRVFATINDYL